MMKREGSKIVINEEALKRIDEGFCPSCGLSKDSWMRTTKYRCCSKQCTQLFYDRYVIATSWNDFRYKVFMRDEFTCKDCGYIFPSDDLICDHIVPIALGGNQWDMINCQTLCSSCNKKKTKDDISAIAKARRAEKGIKKISGRRISKDKLIPLYREAIAAGDLIGTN